MAVIRVIKNENYTTMSNYHLRDENLSLRAKGLMSIILSLPDNWDYSVRGLAAICKEGRDAVSKTIEELEMAGYIVRRQGRSEAGTFGKIEYLVYEQPQLASAAENAQPHPEESDTVKTSINSPRPEKPDTVKICASLPYPENPDTVNPDTVSPDPDIPPQLSTKELSTEELSKENNNINSASIASLPKVNKTAREEKRDERNTQQVLGCEEREHYRRLLTDRLRPAGLKKLYPAHRREIDSFFELAYQTVCSSKSRIRIGGEELPAETVRARLLSLNTEHLEQVLTAWEKNTTKVRNPRQYMLAMLYNAPISMKGHDEPVNPPAPQPVDMEALRRAIDKI